MQHLPIPTRQAGLERLEAFIPGAAEYAFRRNFADPDASTVSKLSPYLRHRLISEEEVCRAVLQRHSFAAVEKFIQEVAWRTYWKGWLEMRPGVWASYLADCRRLSETGVEGLESALAGHTGIDCFDAWVYELIQTGYLHNHVRMWFASIWIFTLQLPWQLGADFFYQHLLDADPASNTLSWRWVAGLQTPGKHYLARAENIQKYTEGRFNPKGILNENAPPLPAEPPVPRIPLRQVSPLPADRAVRRGLLVLGEDLSPEAFLPRDLHLESIAWGGSETLQPDDNASTKFVQAALNDVSDRLQAHFKCPFVFPNGTTFDEKVQNWAAESRLEEILVVAPAVGPWQAQLDCLCPPCTVRKVRRQWDAGLYPNATAGYFRFRKCCVHGKFLKKLLDESVSNA